MKKGDYVKINTAKLKKAPYYAPQWEKLVKQMIKKGHGEVYVVDVKDKDVEVAESQMGAIIGTARVPKDAIKESVLREVSVHVGTNIKGHPIKGGKNQVDYLPKTSYKAQKKGKIYILTAQDGYQYEVEPSEFKKLKETTDHRLRSIIRSAISEYLTSEQEEDKIDVDDEFDKTDVTETSSVGGMGGADGYQTPAAFVGCGGKERKKKWLDKVNKIIGYEQVWDEEDADQLGTGARKVSNYVGKNEGTNLNELKVGDFAADIGKSSGGHRSVTGGYVYKVEGDKVYLKDKYNNKLDKPYPTKMLKKMSYSKFEKLIDEGILKEEKKYVVTAKIYDKKRDRISQPMDKKKAEGLAKSVESDMKMAIRQYKVFSDIKVEPLTEVFNEGKSYTVVAIKNDKVVDQFHTTDKKEIDDVISVMKKDNKGATISVESPGGQIIKVVKEGRRGAYHEYRDDDSKTTRQKLGHSIREIRNQLREIEKKIDLNYKLKTETGIANADYWKGTRTALGRLAEIMNRLQHKIRRF